MEFAGVDKTARSKMGVWTMQEWTYRHGKGGQCGRNNTVTKAAYKISSLEVENDLYTYSQI